MKLLPQNSPKNLKQFKKTKKKFKKIEKLTANIPDLEMNNVEVNFQASFCSEFLEVK